MKDVEHIEYYSGGEIQSIINYLDDNLHGESILYYRSGEISSICNYKDGKYHGECIYYFVSGEVESKYYYIFGNGVSEFEWISYNRNIKLELLGL